ncbi:MAG TPA: zf-HC2 domain-containing protein [Gemmatimonadales bacterium]|nr:zf-HC2 domain-containing protein [Gemmatimonadales bacterium]
MRHPDDGLIEEYLDGELPAETRLELAAHAAECAACRERIEAARATREEADEIVALLGEPAPRSDAGNLPASLRPAARRPIRWRNLAWAASLVAAAGLGYAGGAGRFRPTETARVEVDATEPPGRAAEPAAEPQLTAPPSDVAAGRPGVAPATPPTRRLEEAAPLAKQRVDGESAPPLESREEERQAEADPAAAGRAQLAVPPSFRPAATLDDAVRALGGGIRLLDGLDVREVSVAWLPMPGGDSAAVVELTYADAAGHPIILRQSRSGTKVSELAAADAAQRNAAPAQAYAPGAAAVGRERAAAKADTRDGELTWIDTGGFKLVLRADADADSLARLRARVR